MVVRIFLTEISVIIITIIIIIITTVFEFILHTESDTYNIIFTDVFIVEKIEAKNFEI